MALLLNKFLPLFFGNVFFRWHVWKILEKSAPAKSEWLGILMGSRLKWDTILVNHVLFPPQERSMGSVRVTGYGWADEWATRTVGWAHGGGAHVVSSLRSGTDLTMDGVLCGIVDRPFISCVMSAHDCDVIMFTEMGICIPRVRICK